MKKIYQQPILKDMFDELEEEIMLQTSTTNADPSLESLSRESVWDDEE